MNTQSGGRRPPPRERLLEAAFDLFYSDGYGVSIDTIAERADVAKPTVYAHFASKEALIEGVLRSVDEQWWGLLAAELERRRGDPLARLMAPFDLLVTDLRDDYRGCILLNSGATFCAPEHPARRVLADHDERMRAELERLAGEAGAARPAEMAGQLLVLYDGVKARGVSDASGAAAADARAVVTALLGDR